MAESAVLTLRDPLKWLINAEPKTCSKGSQIWKMKINPVSRTIPNISKSKIEAGDRNFDHGIKR